MPVSPLPPSFLTRIVCLCYLPNVRPCVSSSTFLSSGPFVWIPPLSILGIVPSILQVGLPRYLFILWDLCNRVFCSSEIFFFNFFFPLCLFYDVRFQYFQVSIIYLFSKSSDSFLIWLFNSFRYLSFSTLMGIANISIQNSIPTSWLYILIVCIRVSNSFFYFSQTIWCRPCT